MNELLENIVVIGIFIILCTLPSLPIIARDRKVKKLKKYLDITIGMSEAEMLTIMGEDYSRSILKNNRMKYEWRVNAVSYGSSYKGSSIRSYSGVQKVTIYTKNGIVEEIKPFNV